MDFLKQWRAQLLRSHAEFAEIAPDLPDIDFKMGLAAILLWPIREAVQAGDPTATAAVRQIVGGNAPRIVAAVQAWPEDQTAAVRTLAQQAATNSELQAAIDRLIAHFVDLPRGDQYILSGKFNQAILNLRSNVIGGEQAILTLTKPERPAPFFTRFWRWLAAYTPLGQRYFQAYRKNLAADFSTLDSWGRPIELPLEQIYIALCVSKHVSPNWQPVPGPDDKGKRGEDLRRAQRREQAMEVEEALARSSRIVILGNPGAGKTTLLKYLALRVAQGDPQLGRVVVRPRRRGRTAPLPIPIFLTLNNLARDGHSLKEGMLDELVRRGFSHARLFLERVLSQGRCLCLLDGLDEVADDAAHSRLIGEINDLATAYPGNHLLVTSRVAGYRYHLRGSFALLEVVEFDREQIRCFLESWFQDQPGRAEGLLAALAASPRMRLLAANPLLLSIIALIYEQDLRLPERRVELYDRCVWMLVEEWDRVRDVRGDRRFAPDTTHQWLAALALCFQQSNRIAMDRNRLLGYLEEILPQADRARSFLDEVVARTGLLRQLSRTSYGFAHLTIQEYLAARAIRQGVRVVDGAVALGNAYSPYEDGIVHLLERLGQEHPRYADALIFEQWLRENIAQARRHGDTTGRQAVRSEVIEQLNGLALAAVGTPFNQLCRLAAPAGEGLAGTHSLVLAHLEDPWWRETIILLAGLERDATALIRDILAAGPDSIEMLLLAVRCLVDADETDPSLRMELVGRMVAYLKETADYRLVRGVEDLADALGEAGWAELTGLLKDPDPVVRIRIAELLGVIGAERGVSALLETALGDGDSVVRTVAGNALREIGGDIVISSLLKVLRDPESKFRVQASEALGQVDRSVLFTLLRDSNEPNTVRALAADALGRDNEACKLLPPLFDDPEVDAITRWLASEALRFAFIFVPAGEFLMGDDKGYNDEKPQHTVHLEAYYIARYLVTETQYHRFVAATGHKAPEHWQSGRPPKERAGHPVVNVTWEDAVAYCAWLAEDMELPIRLPTEAEWEKAARGTAGRTYPWGDEFDKTKCNTFASRIKSTTPVGRYSPAGDSPYGACDMAGNVREWTSSLYEDYPYQADDGREDPIASGDRVLRSGSFCDHPNSARCAYRNLAHLGILILYRGFRCVLSPDHSLQ
jgi:formylglycine-generating enzyme required for sulfatase activity